MITNSLQWESERLRLKTQILGLPYNADLRRILRNIDDMVVELSKIEVDARRTKSNTKVNGQLAKIETAINTLEQWLIMAALLQ